MPKMTEFLSFRTIFTHFGRDFDAVFGIFQPIFGRVADVRMAGRRQDLRFGGAIALPFPSLSRNYGDKYRKKKSISAS